MTSKTTSRFSSEIAGTGGSDGGGSGGHARRAVGGAASNSAKMGCTAETTGRQGEPPFHAAAPSAVQIDR